MALRAIRRFRELPDLVQRQVDAVIEWSRQLDRVPWLDGVLLERVPLAAGANVINHRLARLPRGWWLVRREAAAAVAAPVETTRSMTTLTLNSNGTETVSLWIW